MSEKLQHHPDWSGVYNKVNRLSTHDAGVLQK
ncbi:MAG: 4a-hydroxytetrahydrobiopterin dehydratase [Segetibacter sp.]